MSTQSNPLSAAAVDAAVVFDVRPIPGRTKHAQIFERWFGLPVGEYFVLLNDHDPIPLRYQFEVQFPGAFTWEYLEKGPEEFRVKITKLAPVAAVIPEPPRFATRDAPPSAAVDGVRLLDVRGLEPPEPLVRILSALESLPVGEKLRACTDREPCHLFGEADQRGFKHECSQQLDGSWITLLARA